MNVRFRKGDRVLVEATIETGYELDGGLIKVSFDDRYGDAFVKIASIAMKQPKFEVGDEVTTDGVSLFTILAIEGEAAWLKSVMGRRTCDLAELQRYTPPTLALIPEGGPDFAEIEPPALPVIEAPPMQPPAPDAPTSADAEKEIPF